MDYLATTGLEPQLAIPVIVVVVGALLVYVFGFQKSEEPSLEHLAVLQSTSSYKSRSVTNTKSKNSSVANRPKDKSAQNNGHVVHEKERHLTASKKKETSTAASNKENKPPKVSQPVLSKKAKQESVRPADFDSGDWIQATSRKDKKKQPKKDEPKEIVVPDISQDSVKSNKAISDNNEESVLKETHIQIQNQTTQTTPKPSPEKKSKKGAKDASTLTGLAGLTSQETSPIKQKPSESKQEKAITNQIIVNGDVEDSTGTTDLPSENDLPTSEVEAKPKGNIAFDEMGETVDAWEEAKSRGNKKRRARKD